MGRNSPPLIIHPVSHATASRCRSLITAVRLVDILALTDHGHSSCLRARINVDPYAVQTHPRVIGGHIRHSDERRSSLCQLFSARPALSSLRAREGRIGISGLHVLSRTSTVDWIVGSSEPHLVLVICKAPLIGSGLTGTRTPLWQASPRQWPAVGSFCRATITSRLTWKGRSSCLCCRRGRHRLGWRQDEVQEWINSRPPVDE